MQALHILHVDDHPFQRELIEGMLTPEIQKWTIKLTGVSSLEEMQALLDKEHAFAIAILDGRFFDKPNWKIDFYLPAAIILLKWAQVSTILAYSWETERINNLPEWVRPTAFFDKNTKGSSLLMRAKIRELIESNSAIPASENQ